MSALCNLIDTNWLAFAAAVAVGGMLMAAVACAIGAWEEMHR
jgi:hypothetical protein